MGNLKIGTRLFALLGLLVVLTAFVGAVGIFDLHERNVAMERLYRDEMVPLEDLKTLSDDYSNDIVDAAHKVAVGSISWDAAIAMVDSAQQSIGKTWGDYKSTNLTSLELSLVNRAEPEMQQAGSAINALRRILKDHNLQQLNQWISGEMYRNVDPVVGTLDLLAHDQDSTAQTENQKGEARYARALWIIGLLTVLSVVIAGFWGYAVIRDIVNAVSDTVASAERIAAGDLTVANIAESTRADEMGDLHRAMSRMVANLAGLIGDVQRSGIQLNTSATEISATSRQQQTTATEVASTTLEVGATARQISATSKELVRTMHDITESADSMASLANSGQQGLSRMESSMQQITEATSGINTRFAVLNDRAANINTVVTTIAKVADRTNLLSLNAAIEAEKAGEYGRGFAVVASEIRRLADQTADATTDIEQMVREIQSAISAGVMGTDKFSEEVRRAVEAVGEVGGQLSDIIHQVQTVTPRFDAVVDGMQSQSDGAQQISEALAQLGEASQQTVESLVQSTEALEQLNEAARGLQNGVQRFKVSA